MGKWMLVAFFMQLVGLNPFILHKCVFVSWGACMKCFIYLRHVGSYYLINSNDNTHQRNQISNHCLLSKLHV